MASPLFVYKLRSPHDLCLSILFSIGIDSCLLGIDDPGHCNALSSAHTVSDTPPEPGLQAYRAVLGHKWLN